MTRKPKKFTATDFCARARERLAPSCAIPADLPAAYRLAAVLVPIIARKAAGSATEEEIATVLLTVRAPHLSAHGGQIAFPGGKVETSDSSPASAALREAREEIGLESAYIDIAGYLPGRKTGTGFFILPVIGLIEPGFGLRPDPAEVVEVFEVPLDFLMNPANHQRHRIVWQDSPRSFWAMRHGRHVIWGATAQILRDLFARLYEV